MAVGVQQRLLFENARRQPAGPTHERVAERGVGAELFFLTHRRSGERLEQLLLTSSAGAEQSVHHSYSGITAGAHE